MFRDAKQEKLDGLNAMHASQIVLRSMLLNDANILIGQFVLTIKTDFVVHEHKEGDNHPLEKHYSTVRPASVGL